MTALTVDQLLAWLEKTSSGWKDLLTQHPEALALPCDVMGVSDVAGLVQHIVAVELRYIQRLRDQPPSSYEHIPKGSAEELFATHDRAMAMLRTLLARTDFDWEKPLAFTTRIGGTYAASGRVILVHLSMHAIRHYAQLATLVRQNGIAPGWHMDYLFMEALG